MTAWRGPRKRADWTLALMFNQSIDTSPSMSCWSDERQIRHQIDRAIGRALVDHSFAKRLLAEPELAVETKVCTQAQYLAVREIQAHELDDFARQVKALFWGRARYPHALRLSW